MKTFTVTRIITRENGSVVLLDRKGHALRIHRITEHYSSAHYFPNGLDAYENENTHDCRVEEIPDKCDDFEAFYPGALAF